MNCERIDRPAARAIDCVCEGETGPVTENLALFFTYCQTDSNCPNLYNENEPLSHSRGFCGLRSTWADFRRALYVQLTPSRPLSCIMMLISDVQRGEGATVMPFFFLMCTVCIRTQFGPSVNFAPSTSDHYGNMEKEKHSCGSKIFRNSCPERGLGRASRVVLPSLLLRVRSSEQRLRSLLSSSLHRFAPSMLLATYGRLVHKMNASSGGANYFLDNSQGQSLPVLHIPC